MNWILPTWVSGAAITAFSPEDTQAAGIAYCAAQPWLRLPALYLSPPPPSSSTALMLDSGWSLSLPLGFPGSAWTPWERRQQRHESESCSWSSSTVWGLLVRAPGSCCYGQAWAGASPLSQDLPRSLELSPAVAIWVCLLSIVGSRLTSSLLSPNVWMWDLPLQGEASAKFPVPSYRSWMNPQ